MTDTAVLQPIPSRDLLPAAGLAFLLMLQLYLVGYDQGGLSQSGRLLHELLHDGRHLLGLPCH